MRENIIEIENLTFGYDKNSSEKILEKFDLTVKRGEFLTILGHNGSGKSTLAKLLNGILAPLEGDILVDGKNTRDEDEIWNIRQIAGLVFQNPDNQIVSTIVEEDIAFGPENQGIDPKEIKIRVDEALEAVGMSKYRLKAPHLLSGGQKQRVAIAGILAMRPDCIILDEPTSMLDPKGREEIMETLKSLNESGKTIINITHNMNEAIDSDRIIIMKNGEIVMNDIPEKIFGNVDELRELSLDVPQIIELSNELKKEGFIIEKNIISIDELVALL